MFNYDEFKQDLKNNNAYISHDSTDSSGIKNLAVPFGMVRDNRPIIVSFAFDRGNTCVLIMAGVELKRVTPSLTQIIERVNSVGAQEIEPMQLVIKDNRLLCTRIIKNDGRYNSLHIGPLATQQTDVIEEIFNKIRDI